MPNINDLLWDHVTLDVECVDRLYLNGYIPLLQTGGQWVTLIREHRKRRQQQVERQPKEEAIRLHRSEWSYYFGPRWIKGEKVEQRSVGLPPTERSGQPPCLR